MKKGSIKWETLSVIYWKSWRVKLKHLKNNVITVLET